VALEHKAELVVGLDREVMEHASTEDKLLNADVATIRRRVGGRELP
jgi:hypothetical protein